MKDLVTEAIKLAHKAHMGDSWGSMPYTVHLGITADYARRYSEGKSEEFCEQAVAAAWLHGVIEDHQEYREIIARKFPKLIKTLDSLNHKPDMPYDDYIASIIASGDDLAIIVKLSDMSCNFLNARSPRLIKKYESNYTRLTKAWVDSKNL